MKEIAEKLKAFRSANRMTLKQLGNRAGCTDAYLSQLERGRANPSIMILKKIAAALGVKVVEDNDTPGFHLLNRLFGCIWRNPSA